MPAYLLDANLSPNVARHLSREFGLDVAPLRGPLRELPDRDVIAMKYRQGRVVITLDRDFADHVLTSNRPPVGVIYLDLPNAHRTVAAVNHVLDRFFGEEASSSILDGSLTILTDAGPQEE